MYFSKHNEKTVYINHYSGLLEVEGSGPLCREDADVWHAGKNWANGYNVLHVKEGITELGDGYLGAFPKIKCLILSRSVTEVATDPELDDRMRRRKLLIRGEYDTYAERFANEKGLRFLHCDIPLATVEYKEHYETDIITLRFFEKGSPDIHFNCFTPGSSAGSYGGGEYTNDLPQNFYVGCTVEAFADKLTERAREQILNNDMLRRFLRISNLRYERSHKPQNGG